MNQFERIFAVHRQLLAHRNGIRLAELAEQAGCSRAGALRAVQVLQDVLKAPLEVSRQYGYRYIGESRFELPGLWFSGEELVALLTIEDLLLQQPFGLVADSLRPLRKRLEALVGTAHNGRADWRGRLRLARSAGRSAGRCFALVASATANRRRLKITYHARHDGRMAPREVSPQRLTLYRDNWYLEAWCHKRQDLRIFALDRIIQADPLDQSAQDIPARQLDQVLTTSYGIFAGQATAVAELRFSARTAPWVKAERWHPQQQDICAEDGSLTRRIPYHHDRELLMDILRHGPDVEVLGPESLRNAAIQQLGEALAVYQRASIRGVEAPSQRPADAADPPPTSNESVIQLKTINN